MTTVLLLRHGSPLLGTGVADPPLNPQGRSQSEQIARTILDVIVSHRFLDVGLLYSPTRRTAETGTIIADYLAPRLDREVLFGHHEDIGVSPIPTPKEVREHIKKFSDVFPDALLIFVSHGEIIANINAPTHRRLGGYPQHACGMIYETDGKSFKPIQALERPSWIAGR